MGDARSAADASMRELFTGGKYSDLTVHCGELKFDVHKAIVCSRSSWFAKACEEDRWKEGRENVIRLEAIEGESDDDDLGKDDPAAVQCMFQFLYCHEYKVPDCTLSSEEASDPTSACIHAQVYALGAKYGIPTLKETAREQFKHAAELSWKAETLCKAICIVFTTTADEDKGLRDIVIEILSENANDLADIPAIEQVIRSIEGLGYSLWKKSILPTSGHRCTKCGKVFVKRCEECQTWEGNVSFGRNHFVVCACDPKRNLCQRHQVDSATTSVSPAASSFFGAQSVRSGFGGAPATTTTGGLFGAAQPTARPGTLFGGGHAVTTPQTQPATTLAGARPTGGLFAPASAANSATTGAQPASTLFRTR